MPLDKQRVGTLTAGDVEADLILVPRRRSGGGKIWLISADTLAKVPELYEQAAVHQVETHLPQFLVRHEFLGLPLWQWLAILLAIPVAAVLGWLAVQFLRLPWYFWARYRKHAVATAWSSFERPLWLVLGVLLHGILVSYVRIPVLQRHHYQQIAGVVAVIGANWLLWRILREVMRSVRHRAVLSGRMGTGSLMLLGERMLKAAIFVLAIFVVLGTLGFNLTTPLAGLGIGGIAIAFAAQKTLENLFGGVSLLGDEVIRVGDVCRFGDRVGTVEDISLRSTRIRTPERTELSIPNGSLATMNVENLSRRDKILFNTKLGLRYETSPDQMRYVLAQVRRLLYEHPKVETQGARNRFISFDESALDDGNILLHPDSRQRGVPGHPRRYPASDHGHCGRGGHRLCLPVADRLSGPGHRRRQGKGGAGGTRGAEVAGQQQLPFPDSRPADISEISNSLPYPQPGSAVGKKKRRRART